MEDISYSSSSSDEISPNNDENTKEEIGEIEIKKKKKKKKEEWSDFTTSSESESERILKRKIEIEKKNEIENNLNKFQKSEENNLNEFFKDDLSIDSYDLIENELKEKETFSPNIFSNDSNGCEEKNPNIFSDDSNGCEEKIPKNNPKNNFPKIFYQDKENKEIKLYLMKNLDIFHQIDELIQIKKKYHIITIDCPWSIYGLSDLTHFDESKKKLSGEPMYPLLSFDNLKKLKINQIIEKDGILLMWFTN
jgi:hypothetical protein